MKLNHLLPSSARRLTQAASRWLLATTLALGAVAAPAGQTVTYFHNDISGSPLVETDASGNVVWKEAYKPYGERLNNSSASTDNKVWFHGRPQDKGIGLSYMGARYYDPVIGRFTGVDPEAVDPEEPSSFNRYAYAANNPYRYVDPDGHSPIDVAFLVWDIGKLGVALYTGVGVGAAVADVAMSVVGVASPIPGAGQALKAARAAEHSVNIARGALSKADDVAKAGGDLVQKAEAIRKAGTHPASVNQRTIAVGEDASGALHAGSSNGFDRGQRAAAEKMGIRCVKSKCGSHAEENLMREVPDLRRVGTSKRSPCGAGEHNCRGQLEQRGVGIDND